MDHEQPPISLGFSEEDLDGFFCPALLPIDGPVGEVGWGEGLWLENILTLTTHNAGRHNGLSLEAIRKRIAKLEAAAKKHEKANTRGIRAAAKVISKYDLSMDDLKKAMKGQDVAEAVVAIRLPVGPWLRSIKTGKGIRGPAGAFLPSG